MKIICPNCQKEYHLPDHAAGKKARCKQCSSVFRIESSRDNRPVAQAVQTQTQTQTPKVKTSQKPKVVNSNLQTCKICGGPLVRKKISRGNAAGIAMALIVFAIGLALCFTFPCAGIFIGFPMMICSLFMGGKREKVLCCKHCKAIAAKTI